MIKMTVPMLVSVTLEARNRGYEDGLLKAAAEYNKKVAQLEEIEHQRTQELVERIGKAKASLPSLDVDVSTEWVRGILDGLDPRPSPVDVKLSERYPGMFKEKK